MLVSAAEAPDCLASRDGGTITHDGRSFDSQDESVVGVDTGTLRRLPPIRSVRRRCCSSHHFRNFGAAAPRFMRNSFANGAMATSIPSQGGNAVFLEKLQQ